MVICLIALLVKYLIDYRNYKNSLRIPSHHDLDTILPDDVDIVWNTRPNQ